MNLTNLVWIRLYRSSKKCPAAGACTPSIIVMYSSLTHPAYWAENWSSVLFRFNLSNIILYFFRYESRMAYVVCYKGVSCLNINTNFVIYMLIVNVSLIGIILFKIVALQNYLAWNLPLVVSTTIFDLVWSSCKLKEGNIIWSSVSNKFTS